MVKTSVVLQLIDLKPLNLNPTQLQSKPVQNRFFPTNENRIFNRDCPKPVFTEVAQTGAEPVRLLAKPVQHRFLIHRFQTSFHQQNSRRCRTG